MQNSAASCCIVGVLSLATAVITGSFGVWHRQLSACMITGVMYIVAGKFIIIDVRYDQTFDDVSLHVWHQR
jgi:uncharacterized membrane protein YjjP (DUF1212 family)